MNLIDCVPDTEQAFVKKAKKLKSKKEKRGRFSKQPKKKEYVDDTYDNDAVVEITEANKAMAQVIHQTYNDIKDSSGSKKQFIKLLMKRTGLTSRGIKNPDIQDYLDTLVFRRD